MSDPQPPEPAAAPPVITFEQSLDDLQRIVASLERGELGLEQALNEFERGVCLLRVCHETLEHATRRLEVLTGFDASGQPVTQPFDATATFPSGETPPKKRTRRKAVASDSSTAADFPSQPSPAVASPEPASPLPPDDLPTEVQQPTLF